MIITLKDGSTTEVNGGSTPLEIARGLSQRLYKNALAAKVNGKLTDLTANLYNDCELEILTFEDEGGRWALRHTASHILAQAVKKLFPEAKLAIGPAIDTGFYYDFDVDKPFSVEDFNAIEDEMRKIIRQNSKLERFELPRAEAIKFMEEKSEPYKVELINDLPEDAVISFYEQEGFVDLCAGPHVPSTGYVKHVKLMSVAGAYWRGDENNRMLSRIYGTAFADKSELDAYLFRIEEAKKRDHRKLGRELDLFSMHDEGPGFPFYHPNGMILMNNLLDFWRAEHTRRGYLEIKSPVILNRELWIQSGHWDHYKDNMYFTRIDDEDYAIKPMNCPGGMLVYKRRLYSYRELPVRMAELGLVHRHELSGALHGLMRVRCFTQDDAHIFMTPEQIEDEIFGVIDLTDYIYKVFGFKYHVELSTRPENSMGSDEAWESSTKALRDALIKKNVQFTVNEGDGAFYGPKIDFHLEDTIGRTWQCGTIQLDMQMPERFELSYIGEDGEKHRPVMIHRTVLGSVDRFIGILTEHCAGAFPVWLAPVQARVMSLTDRTVERSREVQETLMRQGIRAELDIRNEKIGYKIREARNMRIPYMVVIGDKEAESGAVSVRRRGKGDLGVMELDALIAQIKTEIDEMVMDL